MRSMRALLVATLVAAAGCSRPGPIDVRPGDACAHCRMAVSDGRFAAQIAAPGEEPQFYDDLGCFSKSLAGGKASEHAFVADHRTREWVAAKIAVFTFVPRVETPMGSRVIAHANEASRQADPAAAHGTRVSLAQIGTTDTAGGRHRD